MTELAWFCTLVQICVNLYYFLTMIFCRNDNDLFRSDMVFSFRVDCIFDPHQFLRVIPAYI